MSYDEQILRRTYKQMLSRCYEPQATGYVDYGDRGIRVCKRWRDSFEYFAEDMGPRPSNNYSIDRVDNNGDYKLSNCRWATKSQQMANRRKRKEVQTFYIDGEEQTVSQLAKKYNVKPSRLYARLQMMNIEDALDIPEKLKEPVYNEERMLDTLEMMALGTDCIN